MSKKKESSKAATAKRQDVAIGSGVFDPALASLFASSAGPVKVPERKRTYVDAATVGVEDVTEEDTSSSDTEKVAIQAPVSSNAEIEVEEPQAPPRKRRKVNQEDELELNYLNKLAREEEKEVEASRKEQLSETKQTSQIQDKIDIDDNASVLSASNDLLDLSDSEADVEAAVDAVPVHESLTGHDKNSDQNRRTVFLSNVCTSAIRSKSARKALITHLKSALNEKEKEKIESIRFRSTAFDVSAGPKKAAFAKKELMDQTTRNTNAYVVMSSEAAARRVASKLNGTTILDRHVHIDSLANPMRTDNKRCVFVGNLPFVDEETTAQDSEDEDADGAKSQRSRQKAKHPADAEEGLWRTFSKCGKVESVRVVRDRATRVGKGFAYVQFEDGNGVEKALLLDGKKFPPLLPRLLRISRAKGVKRKEVRARESLRGKEVHKGRRRDDGKGKRKMDGVVFEGYRASSANRMKFKVKGKKKQEGAATKPNSRSSRRGTAFKAAGGKKQRDQ